MFFCCQPEKKAMIEKKTMNSAEVVHQERPATSAPLEDMIFHVLLLGIHKGKNEHHCQLLYTNALRVKVR